MGPCDKIPPIAKVDASVVILNGLLKSGYANIGSLINSSLHKLKHSINSHVFAFFFKHLVKGTVNFEKSLINLL